AVCSAWLARTTWELPLIAREGAVLLELHWSLAPRWFPAPVIVEDVVASAADRAFAGSHLRWPAAARVFLIPAAHGVESGGVGIRWLADLAALLRAGDIDWQRTRDIASRNAGLNVARVALAVADTLASTAAESLELSGLAIELPGAARALLEDVRRSSR